MHHACCDLGLNHFLLRRWLGFVTGGYRTPGAPVSSEMCAGERCQPAITNGYCGEPTMVADQLKGTRRAVGFIIGKLERVERVQDLHGTLRASAQGSEAPTSSGRHRSPCVTDPRGRG